jgi:hypothetical protein
MNIKYIAILAFLLTRLISNAEELAENEKDLREFDPEIHIPVSELPMLLSKASLNKDKLTIEQIKNIFKNNRDSLYGGNREVSKFFTLQALCDLAVSNKESVRLSDFIRGEIAKLDLSKETTKFWPEMTVASRGGTLGLLIETEIRISKFNGFKAIYDQAIINKDLECLALLLSKIFEVKEAFVERNLYLNFLKKEHSEKSTLPEVKALISNTLEREKEREKGSHNR